jgi:hypothetical protein
MKLRYLIDEDFINYKKAAMVIGFPNCSMKCNIDSGREVCQNSSLKDLKLVDISSEDLCKRYLNNGITKAVVCQGLEPFDSPFELTSFIDELRNKFGCKDDIVIYTGYTEEECNGIASKEYDGVNFARIHAVYNQLKLYGNIIVKFGRFIPGREKVFDEVLGIELASDNQYAKMI